MLIHSSGYVFDARIDCNGKKGIKESFTVFNNTATVVCGIDGVGKIAKAVTHIGKDGFVSLSEILDTPESIQKYMKSHKATYAIIGESAYIAKIIYNMTKKTVTINVYIPQGDIPIYGRGGKTYPGVVCHALSTAKGSRTFTVAPKLFDSIVLGIENQVLSMDWSTRDKYLLSRM